MVSWLYLMQPIGMVLVGVAAVAYWYARKHTALKYFLYGGILWALAIGIKLVMDYTVTKPLYDLTASVFSPAVTLILLSLYIGLRTGLLENLIPYLAFKKAKPATMDFDRVIAIGIGFGAAEAIVLGAYNVNVVYTLVQQLDTLDLLSPVSLDQQSLINVLLPSCERFFTLLIHTFAVALVFYSLKENNPGMLIIAIVYKAITDGLIMPFRSYFGVDAIWAIEAYVVVLGLLGLAGLWWLKLSYGGKKETTGVIGTTAQ